METNLSFILKGKATTIKGKNYFSTEKYVSPFIEKMNAFTSDFIVKAMLPSQITVGNDSQDITYNKVWIQGVLPEKHDKENHSEVIGMIYALDVRKPLVKFYHGYLNKACLNLSIFDPKWINVQELEPDTVINYSGIKEYLEAPNDFELTVQKLKNEFLSKEDVINILGKWVDICLKRKINNKIHTIKLSPSIIIDAYNSLFIDEDSSYFIPESKEASMFDIYNAFTQQLTDDQKDIINIPDKTLLIKQILSI